MSTKLFVAIVIVASCSFPALAQVDSTAKKTNTKSVATAAPTTRSRRATPSSPAEDPAPVKNASAQDPGANEVAKPAEPTAQTAPAKPAEKTPEKPIAKPATETKPDAPTPSLSLREQIDATSDLQTKVGLQRKLADELIASGNKAE